MQNRFKKLGIIGGMGPFADVLFLELLHTHTVGNCDGDYIPTICDGNCLRPDRSSYIVGYSKKSPQKSLIRSLRLLESADADVIVITCNTAHLWLPCLLHRKKRKTVFIDMVRQVSRRCYEKGLCKVCLLATPGTYKKHIYSEAFFKMGVDLIYPDEKTQASIYNFICDVKSGKSPPITVLEQQLCETECDAFILGCTELSCSLLRTKEPRLKYIDSLSCLALGVLELFGKNHTDFLYT